MCTRRSHGWKTKVAWLLGAAIALSTARAAADARDDRMAALEAIKGEIAADTSAEWQPNAAAEVARWQAGRPLDAVRAMLDVEMPTAETGERVLPCGLSRRVGPIGGAIDGMVGKAKRCFAQPGEPARCRAELERAWTAIAASLRIDELAIDLEPLARERQAVQSLSDPTAESRVVAAHAMDLCIAAIPAWPVGRAGPIERIERCKSESIAQGEVAISATTEEARLERAVRTARLAECQAKDTSGSPHACRQKYADPVPLAALRGALAADAAKIRRLLGSSAPSDPGVTTQLFAALRQRSCWQKRAAGQRAKGDEGARCEELGAPSAATARDRGAIATLYVPLFRRAFWAEAMSAQGTARTPLRLSCDDEKRADAYFSKWKQSHAKLAACLDRAAKTPTAESLFTAAAQCRATLPR